MQDQLGFLWFSAQNRLNRYDGYHITAFCYDPQEKYSISGNWISALHKDKLGKSWIGALRGGLNYFDPATEKLLVSSTIRQIL